MSGQSGISGAMQSLTLSGSSNLTPQQRREKVIADKLENAKKRKESHARWAKSALKLPPRPVRPDPNSGDEIKANFFRVAHNGTTELHRYIINLDLVNNREPKKRELRRYLISTLLQDNPNTFAQPYACDYFSHIISTGRLWNHPASDDPRPGDATNWRILQHTRTPAPPQTNRIALNSKITYEGSVRMRDLAALVRRAHRQALTFPPEEHFKALNIISWRHINSPAWTAGRVGNKFYPDHVDLRADLHRDERQTINGRPMWVKIKVYEARTGFFTSMRPGDGSLLLNVNTATSAFFPTWDLQAFIEARWGAGIPPLRERTRGELIGLRVTFDGDDPTLNKTRVVAEISNFTIYQQLFFTDSAKTQQRRVFDHMNTTYGPGTPRNLTFTSQDVFCVNLGGTGPDMQRWYPADKLHIIDWQVVPGKVDNAFTKDMLAAAKRWPNENQDRILQHALRPLGIVSSGGNVLPLPFLNLFGLTIDRNFTRLRPRRVGQPEILYRATAPVTASRNWPASWNLEHVAQKLNNNDTKGSARGRGFLVTAPSFDHLCVIRVATRSDPIRVTLLRNWATNDLAPALRRYGFSTANVAVVEAITQVGRQNIVANLTTAANSVTPKPPLFLIVLPDKSATFFPHVKWWGDCIDGTPTICITEDTFRKYNGSRDMEKNSLLANLCLKLNFKLGGRNHQIQNDLAGLKPQTMIFGADVTHSGKGPDPGCPSLAGVVASHGEIPGIRDSGNFHCYRASARLQPNNTENIENLKGMVLDHLRDYFIKSGRTSLPQHILFYRDGVSESQYGMVLEEELPQLRAALDEARSMTSSYIQAYDPQITLLVVGKRHHARFYNSNPTVSRNLAAGLIVDHTVTTPTEFSFYLQSHDSPIGTARSGHYVVIENESNYSPGELQVITNKLCFTGSRATTGLSVCTPARYADILCDRLRCYMSPVLTGDMLATHNDDPVRAYELDTDIWGTPDIARPKGHGPWRNTVGNVMFYL